MSTGAIIMLIISIVVIWGGLLAAVVHLRRHPELPEQDAQDVSPPESR